AEFGIGATELISREWTIAHGAIVRAARFVLGSAYTSTAFVTLEPRQLSPRGQWNMVGTQSSRSRPPGTEVVHACDRMPCGTVLLCRQAQRFFQFSAHHTAISLEPVHPLVPDLFKRQLLFWRCDGSLFHQARLAQGLSPVGPVVLPSNRQGERCKGFL